MGGPRARSLHPTVTSFAPRRSRTCGRLCSTGPRHTGSAIRPMGYGAGASRPTSGQARSCSLTRRSADTSRIAAGRQARDRLCQPFGQFQPGGRQRHPRLYPRPEPGSPEPAAAPCSPRSARHAAAVKDHSAAGPDAIDRDPATFTGCWVDLCTHLEDTECELRALIRNRQCAGFTPDQLEAAALAARFHDLGKAFRHFQDYLRGSAAADPPGDGPWAKSPGRGGRHVPARSCGMN